MVLILDVRGLAAPLVSQVDRIGQVPIVPVGCSDEQIRRLVEKVGAVAAGELGDRERQALLLAAELGKRIVSAAEELTL